MTEKSVTTKEKKSMISFNEKLKRKSIMDELIKKAAEVVGHDLDGSKTKKLLREAEAKWKKQ